ncbi:MAG: SAM-dependent methyltransferase, partial [Gammaproteobacteria bacterium]|nr:SAM-dependent methyltransferase [Gammaproteobacteria bacterium]
MSREFKNRVREQFGRAAEGYIHDQGFATGDDLELMVELLKPMPDD